MKLERINCIIAAAGKSSRFDIRDDKILFGIKNKVLIEHIFLKIKPFSNKVIIICNIDNIEKIKKKLSRYSHKIRILYKIQRKINGMASAVRIGINHVDTRNFILIWGNQLFLKKETIKKSIQNHYEKQNLITLPYFPVKNPYTFIIRGKNREFLDILQKRETNFTYKYGENDCGLFVCKRKELKSELNRLIISKKILTPKTREYDFLKALKFLRKKGKVGTVRAISNIETKGINFKKDIKLK